MGEESEKDEIKADDRTQLKKVFLSFGGVVVFGNQRIVNV